MGTSRRLEDLAVDGVQRVILNSRCKAAEYRMSNTGQMGAAGNILQES